MWAEGCAGGVCYSHAEGACQRGAPEGCRCWEPSEGVCRRRAAVGNHPMPCAMWAEGCAGGVCHSPAEGCARGCRCWEPPHALGGLLCGRGCAGGVCHSPAEGVAPGVCRGAAVGNRRMPWEAYVGGGVRRRDVPLPCRGGVPEGGAGRVPLLGAAACSGKPPMWAEGFAGGVCHSPAEGVRRRGCAGGVPMLETAACPGRPPMGGGVRRRGVP